MDTVILVSKPVAYPAVQWDGTFENLKSIVSWLQKLGYSVPKIEFWEETKDGVRKSGAYLSIDNDHIRLHNKWWVLQAEGRIHYIPEDNLDRSYSVHTTIPKEVPVAAG